MVLDGRRREKNAHVRAMPRATAGSFVSPAHASSPRPHARHEHETEADFPVAETPREPTCDGKLATRAMA
eukprot:9294556-Pyramimonas_sp.AAC.1